MDSSAVDVVLLLIGLGAVLFIGWLMLEERHRDDRPEED